MTFHFCTCFDSNYLIYGYTLYRSLKATGIEFKLYVACLDDTVFQNLQMLHHPEIIPIPLSDIEAHDPEFSACKENRSRVEYIFTLSPVLPLYILRKFPGIDILGYLDSDLYFFSSPEPIYRRLGQASLLIFEHDFAPVSVDFAEKVGYFNMSFQLYRNDETGRKCLEKWRRQCIEWCYDFWEDGKFADQKYLDTWPGEFGAISLNAASGAGVAPWNCFKYQYELSDIPKLCGVPLISFHYQGTKMLRYGLITPCEGIWLPYIPSDLLNFFTGRYYTELCRTRDILRENLGKTAVKSKFTFARVAPADRKKGVRKKRLADYLKDVFYILTGRILFHGHTCFAFCRIRKDYQ